MVYNTNKRDNPAQLQRIMRKIESLMIAAIENDERWQSGNTAVIPGWEGTSDVYLHGNLIATIGDTWVQLFDGDHRTATTKSRLNAILSAYGADGERVFQRAGEWFLNQGSAVIPFISGMRLV